MKILVTGSDGFVGKNLCLAISERNELQCLPINRSSSEQELRDAISEADVIVHLAGVNRPLDPKEFSEVNADFTQRLCELIVQSSRKLPLVITSSIQAASNNPYGLSKKAAEDAVLAYGLETGSPVRVYRLPNVFGKWCKPNYNSVVATFCHNIANDLPISISDRDVVLSLVHVDDLVAELLFFAECFGSEVGFFDINPVYQATVGEIADQVYSFSHVRENLITEPVGAGFTRALYSTYISYLPSDKFSYSVKKYSDPRGTFVEMLKTKDSGQFSYFSAYPGITRGGHYHHSKTEKFLVIRGKALFKFRHVLTDETYSIVTCGEVPIIVETIPGWAHDITNTGDEEMIVMLWANEIFDRNKPDTIAAGL